MGRRTIVRKPSHRQHGKAYEPMVDEILRVIAESHDYIYAKRLTTDLISMAQYLAAHGKNCSSHPACWSN